LAFESILLVFLFETGIGVKLLTKFEELMLGLIVELKATFFSDDVVNCLTLLEKLPPSFS